MKLGVRAMSAEELTFSRFLLGAAVLFPLVALRGEKLPRKWRLWAHITVAALFANAAPYLLFALAEERVASSAAATGFNPIVAIVLGVLVLSETVTVLVLIGVALVLAGQALTRLRPAAA